MEFLAAWRKRQFASCPRTSSKVCLKLLQHRILPTNNTFTIASEFLHGEQIVSATAALRFLDATGESGDSEQPLTVARAILVRSLTRKTEGALLVFDQAACCGTRLLRAIPIVSNIDLQVVSWDGCGSLSKMLDGEGSSKKVILQLPDLASTGIPDQAQPGLTKIESGTLLTKDSDKDSTADDSTRRFLKTFASMQETAERHSYVFPSRKGNHDWLWTYGAERLPLGFRDWQRAEEFIPSAGGSAGLRLGRGVTSIRTFVAERGIPWDKAKPALLEHESEFIKNVPLTVSAVTLNCGANMPPSEGVLLPMFVDQIFPDRDVETSGGTSTSGADIVAVALQETCPLVTAVDITETVNARHHAAWKDACSKTIERLGKYVLLELQHLVGLVLLVFAKAEIAAGITNIGRGSISTGAGGLGNKGAVAIGFLYNSVSLCFVNTHLAAGEKEGNVSDRARDVIAIMSQLRLADKISSDDATVRHVTSTGVSNLHGTDALIVAGDLNMRLWKDQSMRQSQEREGIFSALDGGSKQQEFLSQHDELHLQRAKNGVYSDLEEAPIRFMPTYKLKSMPEASPAPHPSNEQYLYDSKRVPAWCDRVLWRGRGHTEITPHVYERISAVNFSDHRPVRLGLTVMTKDVSWDTILQLCEEVRSRSFSANERSGSFSAFRRHDSILGISSEDFGDVEISSNTYGSGCGTGSCRKDACASCCLQ
jgi:endonuclease/exonuclease/phosphatase family metal-dependent hydrolase